MSVPVTLHPLAELDVLTAWEWHEQPRPGLGDRLVAAVAAVIGRAGRWPNIGTPAIHDNEGDIIERRMTTTGPVRRPATASRTNSLWSWPSTTSVAAQTMESIDPPETALRGWRRYPFSSWLLVARWITWFPRTLPVVSSMIVRGQAPGSRRRWPRWVDALGVDLSWSSELDRMCDVVLAKTASRQVLGVMNEFTFMAEHTISTGRSDPSDLLGLPGWLAHTIVGPLGKDGGHTPLGAGRACRLPSPIGRSMASIPS